MKKKRFLKGIMLAAFAWASVILSLLVMVRAYSGKSLYIDEKYAAKTAQLTDSEGRKNDEYPTDETALSSGSSDTETSDQGSVNTGAESGSDNTGQTDSAAVTDGNEDQTAIDETAAEPEVSYRIEGDNVPVPDESKFVKLSNADAAEFEKIIEDAREKGLLGEDEKVVFSPDVDFVSWGDIRYYYDDSILAVVWKEMKDGRYMTFGEIKVRDPSQFRRKLADDTYGSPAQYFCTQLDEQVNSVVTMNADFYAFRNLGITVYEGEVHRFDTSLDVLFIDQNGDFIYYDRNTDTTKEDIQSFVDDNGVSFSLAFGPVMVRDGELMDISNYPIGQNNERYSRTCLCQVDTLHYLFANIGYFSSENTGGTSSELAQWVWEKGVKEAYMMDGGQTSEIIFNGEIFNLLSYGNERTVSDMIYFATAVGENVNE